MRKLRPLAVACALCALLEAAEGSAPYEDSSLLPHGGRQAGFEAGLKSLVPARYHQSRKRGSLATALCGVVLVALTAIYLVMQCFVLLKSEGFTASVVRTLAQGGGGCSGGDGAQKKGGGAEGGAEQEEARRDLDEIILMLKRYLYSLEEQEQEYKQAKDMLEVLEQKAAKKQELTEADKQKLTEPDKQKLLTELKLKLEKSKIHHLRHIRIETAAEILEGVTGLLHKSKEKSKEKSEDS